METYEVVRFFADSDEQVVIARGLTLDEAIDRCNDPEGSSMTATSVEGRRRTEQCGPWFEGFRKEAR